MRILSILILAALLAGCGEYERGYKSGYKIGYMQGEAYRSVRRYDEPSKQPCCKFKKHEIQVGDAVKMNNQWSDIYKQIRHVESIEGKSVTLCDGSMTDIHWLTYAGTDSLAACKEEK